IRVFHVTGVQTCALPISFFHEGLAKSAQAPVSRSEAVENASFRYHTTRRLLLRPRHHPKMATLMRRFHLRIVGLSDARMSMPTRSEERPCREGLYGWLGL